jgi:hypothetical protein
VDGSYEYCLLVGPLSARGQLYPTHVASEGENGAVSVSLASMSSRDVCRPTLGLQLEGMVRIVVDVDRLDSKSGKALTRRPRMFVLRSRIPGQRMQCHLWTRGIASRWRLMLRDLLREAVLDMRSCGIEDLRNGAFYGRRSPLRVRLL